MNPSVVSGHGPIDYVVVLGFVAYACYALATKPRLLLLVLPTTISVYFFIPLGSMLTPERLVSLMLVAWVAYHGNYKISRETAYLPMIGLILVWLSTSVALSIGDSGTRPLFRALYYTGMIATFFFVLSQTKTKKDLHNLMLGIAIAGLVHGGYALYQLVAFRLGLPFRGIAREGFAGVALIGEGFRINGLASEPKRLGFVLFAAAIAAFATGLRAQSPQRLYWMLAATVIFLVSLLTYSSSYFAALALSIPVLVLLVPRLLRYFLPVMALLALAAVFIPAVREQFLVNAEGMVEARQTEFEVGADGRVVYRQEFFAQRLLDQEPSIGFSGVGMGRYNTVLFDRFGQGAGYSEEDILAPLNSQFLEALLDLGILGPFVIYLGIIMLIYRLWHLRNVLSLIWVVLLLFLTIQSFFVQSLSMLIIAAAGSLAHLRIASEAKEKRKARRRLQAARGMTIKSSPLANLPG